MKKLTLSVIMPALNEEENIEAAIGETLQAMNSFEVQGDIIVVNDGSRDQTGGLVESLVRSDNRIQMIRHDSPMGIGKSFWDGVEQASGDIVVMLPGDNENDPTEILRYFDLLEHVDIVIPFVFNKEVRSLFRNALSFIYRFIINTTFLVYFNYTNGTVLYRKSVLKELDYRSTGFFFQTDILVRTVKKGYLFAEVPYRLDIRTDGVSKAVSFPSFMQVTRGYLRLLRDIYPRDVKHQAKFSKDSLTIRRHNNLK